MRVLIVGGTGMLGHKLCQAFREHHDVFATVRGRVEEYRELGVFDSIQLIGNVDVRHRDNVVSIVRNTEPSVVINAAGVVKQRVDRTPRPDLIEVNSLAPHILESAAIEIGARFITVSTDCVFTGRKGNYTEDDVPDAIDDYGVTKRLGEVISSAALTIRTSIIGRELRRDATGLVEWYLRSTDRVVEGYRKAIFSGLTAAAFAEVLVEVVRDHRSLTGLFHVSGEPISKFDLLRLLRSHFNDRPEVVPNDDVVLDRSLDSTRFCEATGIDLPPMHAMIERMVADPTTYSY
jgi:dTDP-4-dehydrorhamnose reductase